MDWSSEKQRYIVEVYGSEIVLPPMPERKSIQGYEEPKLHQKFKATELPPIFRWVRRDADQKPLWSKEQMEFILQEGYRRIHGYWFYNKGQPTYITGNQYFELNYWKIPLLGKGIGLKDYRDRDRRVHLFFEEQIGYRFDYDNEEYFQEHGKWKNIGWKNPQSLGVIYMKHRRDGATHRSNAIHYNRITLLSGAIGGIQSKTDEDAKKVYNLLKNSWRRLPEFFQPVYDGSTDPKSGLRFYEPPDKSGRIRQDSSLNSEITYANSKSNAYDGTGLAFYHGNEWGKTTESDVYETWSIVKECLALGGVPVGKAIIETTVAEMEKGGGKNFKKIWEESDLASLNENGETTSGLARIFLPAYDGLENYIDEWGFSQIEKAKQYRMNIRTNLIQLKKFEALSQQKRLFPFNEAEALAPTINECYFNQYILETRQEELIDMELKGEESRLIRRGNFVPTPDKKGARWQADPNGKWKVAWLFDKPGDANKIEFIGKEARPLNQLRFCIGCDPIEADKRKTANQKWSNAGAYVYKQFMGESDDLYENNYIAQYLFRPTLSDTFYEDMLWACVYFGCEINLENIKGLGLIKHFDKLGFGKFIMTRPKFTQSQAKQKDTQRGTPPGAETNQLIVRLLNDWIEKYGYKILFKELVEDLLEFDLADTQKSDATMAAGHTQIARFKEYKTKTQIASVTDIGIFSFNRKTGQINTAS